jgi:hypothetical protein
LQSLSLLHLRGKNTLGVLLRLYLSILNVFSGLSNSAPYVAIQFYQRQVGEDKASMDANSGRDLKTPEEIVQEDFYDFYQVFTLVCGLALALLFCLQIITSLCHRHFLRIYGKANGVLARFLSPSNVRGELRLKMAAVRKVNAMLHNAGELHQLHHEDILISGSVQSTANQAMRNFVLHGERSELAGSALWTWRRLLNGSLFHTEGIWINTRLVTIQVAQFLVGIVVSIVLLVSVERIAAGAEEARADLTPDLPQWVIDIVPTPQMVYRALYPATFTAILVMLLLFLLYIPRYETWTSLVCFHHSTWPDSAHSKTSFTTALLKVRSQLF